MSAVSSYLLISSRLLSIHLRLGRPLLLFPGTTMSIIVLDKLSPFLHNPPFFSSHAHPHLIFFFLQCFPHFWSPRILSYIILSSVVTLHIYHGITLEMPPDVIQPPPLRSSSPSFPLRLHHHHSLARILLYSSQ